MSGDFQTHKDNQPHKTYAKVDLDKYAVFVDGVTSNPSKNYQSFIDSGQEVEYNDDEKTTKKFAEFKF